MLVLMIITYTHFSSTFLWDIEMKHWPEMVYCDSEKFFSTVHWKFFERVLFTALV